MKHRLRGICLLLLFLAGVGAAQEKSHFLIRIEPVRATFNEDATPEEARVMSEHFQYLKQLLADGKLVMAGPAETGGRPFGLIVLEVSGQAAAEEIMKNDPSVKARIMRGNVYPFTLSLMKGRD